MIFYFINNTAYDRPLSAHISLPPGHDRALDRVRAAQTDKPIKGMLTGPVTMLNGSFVRDDQPARSRAGNWLGPSARK